MRTPEQIANLRKIMAIYFGPAAFLLEDELVEKWAGRLQSTVDSIKYEWDLKIRITGDDRDWADILVEPKHHIRVSLKEWRDKVPQWFVKYPDLEAVRINIKDSPEDVYIFTKEQQNG